MQERHTNRELYFREQAYTTANYVIPFVATVKSIDRGARVLEVGCGEGGNLVPFLERDCAAVGIDIDDWKMEHARRFLSDHPNAKRLRLITADIYHTKPESIGRFDFIMLRDAIEHIHDQERFLAFVRQLLATDGVIFFGFPPWRMPFGGHQQGCTSRFLSKLPYVHLLPTPLYAGTLRLFGESQPTIHYLMEVRRTRISVRRFEDILRRHRYRVLKQTHYLINPNYEIKFGLRPRVVWKACLIPRICDFYTTALYCLAGRDRETVS